MSILVGSHADHLDNLNYMDSWIRKYNSPKNMSVDSVTFDVDGERIQAFDSHIVEHRGRPALKVNSDLFVFGDNTGEWRGRLVQHVGFSVDKS